VALLQLREDGIAVDPHLLPGWVERAFPIQWPERLMHLRFEANPRRIELAVEKGDELTLAVAGGLRVSLGPASALCCKAMGRDGAIGKRSGDDHP
jgi:trehalose/maltose hydrolase-like predicted phosphorylase